jgi:hypothetical protein
LNLKAKVNYLLPVFFLANRLRKCIIGLSELDITLGNVEKVGKVSFDSKEEFARTKTTDLVIVEKEGITDVILEAAKRYRIALVATWGRFTDYVQELMRLKYLERYKD